MTAPFFVCYALLMQQGKEKKNKKQDLVILLHGLCCPARQMNGLARAFNKAGLAELNIDYQSTNIDFDEFVDLLHTEIEEHKKEYRKIHFVGFSMGGVLTRLYLEKYPPENLGRVLFLGSPMKGSSFVDVLNNLFPVAKIIGFAGSKLSHEHPSLPRKKISYEAGVIAGDKGQIPLLTNAVLGRGNDGIVAVHSTHVEGMKDSIVLPVDHYSFTDHQCVIEQAVRFITKGNFDHKKKYKREFRLPNII